MKRIIIYLGKKYLISAINDLLEKYKNNVSVICETLEFWIERLQVIIEEMKKILARVSDGKIEDDEVKSCQDEIAGIIRSW